MCYPTTSSKPGKNASTNSWTSSPFPIHNFPSRPRPSPPSTKPLIPPNLKAAFPEPIAWSAHQIPTNSLPLPPPPFKRPRPSANLSTLPTVRHSRTPPLRPTAALVSTSREKTVRDSHISAASTSLPTTAPTSSSKTRNEPPTIFDTRPPLAPPPRANSPSTPRPAASYLKNSNVPKPTT